MARIQSRPGSHGIRARLLVSLLPLVAADCSHRADDCRYTLTCGDFVATGGSSDAGVVGGTTASSSSSSSSSATGTSLGGVAFGGTLSTGGTSAVDDGTGGVLATGGAPTCEPACAGEKPICMLSDLNCVECTGHEHCADKATRPYCDIDKNSCVECLDNEDCDLATASACVAGKCSPCSANDDCLHIEGHHVCKIATDADAGAEVGTCVECTGTDYEACRSDAGPSFVCNSLTNECSKELEHSSSLCQACVSDAQCQGNGLCVQEVFKTGYVVGHFCFSRQIAGDSASDCTRKAPYVKAVNATSIDGTYAAVCMLRMSTCKALNEFGRASCASATNTPDDSLCGVAPGEDSKCAGYGSTQFKCTIPCLNSDDCLGLECTTGTPNKLFCSLL